MKTKDKNGSFLSVNLPFKKVLYLLIVCLLLNSESIEGVQLASSTISEMAADDKIMEQTKMLHLAQSSQLPN